MKRREGGSRRVPGGEQLFYRVHARLGCTEPPPRFLVEYHPYAGLTHTIRLREGTARVRLSDVLRAAPRGVVEAAAAILLARLYRRRLPQEMEETYREFLRASDTRKRLAELRRGRARRAEHHPAGVHYDLGPLFERLNRGYFHGALERPRLAWSARAWRTQLGCFDPALNQIVINRRLDHARVPEFVVAYVLYHEMLHQKHPMRFARFRRESHSREFRREEKRFAEYQSATKFLSRFPVD